MAMSEITLSILFATTIFIGVLVCIFVGTRIGRRRIARHGKNALNGFGTIDAALFGLMGLLVAFTFTTAAGRFEDRVNLISDHVNAISTAYLQLDLLEEPRKEELNEMFRGYLDALIHLYETADTQAELQQARSEIAVLESEIWERAVEAARQDKSQPLAQFLLTSLNEMFDMGKTPILKPRLHPPTVVFVMIGITVCICALFAGIGAAKSNRQSPVHAAGFALLTSLSIYLILDLEYP